MLSKWYIRSIHTDRHALSASRVMEKGFLTSCEGEFLHPGKHSA